MSHNEIDEETINKTITKYEYIIEIILAKYRISQEDYEDAMQEGRIGIWKAIKAFQDDKGAKFTTFATLCVNRQILSFLKRKNQMKNKINISSLPLHYWNLDVENDNTFLEDKLSEYVISKIYLVDVFNQTIRSISKTDRVIFNKFIKGYSVSDLSDEYNIPKSKVYIIIARIRKKIQENMNKF